MKGGPPRLPLACYAARSRDEGVLRSSSSGGIFMEAARAVLARGGVVAGAAWDTKDWHVEHRVVRNEAGLAELQGSKYVFSRFTGVLGEMAACLKEGRLVLFTGVPCQVAVVRRRLGDAEGLLTCGIICHNGPDEDVWFRYVAELERKAKSRLASVRFRDKTDGWPRSRAVFGFEDSRRNLSMPLAQCPYMGAFTSGFAARPSCPACPFRSGRAGMDILIGDFWGIQNHLPDWMDGRGASAVVVYSGKGQALFDGLDLEKRPVEYGWIIQGNPMVERSVAPDPEKRRLFLESYPRLGIRTALRIAEEGGAGRWAWHAVLRRLRLMR